MTGEPSAADASNGDQDVDNGAMRVDPADAGEAVSVEPDDGSGAYPTQAPTAEEFGWEGWLLVAVLIFSFLVVPPAIVLLPEARGVVASLGLTMRDAYLALPMVPAILLGATAVWAAVRHRRR